MAASVWIMPVRFSTVRLRAETMPRVTVGSPRRPRALPMATTSSPTVTSAERPSSAAGRLPAPSVTLMRATSWASSAPTTVAVSALGLELVETVTVLAPLTTWALVRM